MKLILIVLTLKYRYIIPTQLGYNYLVQFDWTWTIYSRHLYFDKSNNQESGNNFLLANFLIELFYPNIDVIYDQEMNFIFVDFIDV